MTTFKIVALLVIFSLANKVVVEAIAPESQNEGSPAFAPEQPPTLSPEEKKFFKECGIKITAECAEDIVNYIFFELKWKVPRDCCQKLQLAGQNCHNRLVAKLASFHQFSKYAHFYVAKGGLAWDKCVVEAEFGVSGQ